MDILKGYLKDRFTESSTWRALIWVITSFGVYHLSADQEGAITALGMALAGAHGFLPDTIGKKGE